MTAAADVTDPDACAGLMEVAGERFSRLDAVAISEPVVDIGYRITGRVSA